MQYMDGAYQVEASGIRGVSYCQSHLGGCAHPTPGRPPARSALTPEFAIAHLLLAMNAM